MSLWDEIDREMQKSYPNSLAGALDRDRPYEGQPHTSGGERGRLQVAGMTVRDIEDCYVRACYDSSGLSPDEWPGSLDDLPWDRMDPVAVMQNLGCWIERYMGVFPNVPRLYPTDPTDPHWCGPNLDTAVFRAHEGPCIDDDREPRS